MKCRILIMLAAAAGISFADKTQVQQAANDLAVNVIGKKEVVKVSAVEQVGGKYAVAIEYKMTPAWNNAATRKAIIFELRRVAEKAVTAPGMEEISEITLCPITEATDKSEFNVARIGLPMSEIKKHDWNGTMRIPENIEALAKSKGELWWHPAIQ